MKDFTEKKIEGENIYIEIIEERTGIRLNNQGVAEETYNMYAGIGYEIETEEYERTGRIIAWAGNNSTGIVEAVDSINLDDYLSSWESEWQDDFKNESVMEA